MIRKKIIEIIPQLNSGGAERFVVDLSNELVKYHDVTLIILFPIKTHGFYIKELNPSIKVISLNKRVGIDLSLPFRLAKILLNEKAVIAHTHLNSIYYALPSIIGAGKKLRFFHTIHNDALKEAPGKKGALIKRFLFKDKFCQPITISKSSHYSFQKLYGFSAPIIENGRFIEESNDFDFTIKKELENYKTSADTLIFINVGRIVPQKNQLMLVKSIDRLVEEGFDIVLLIIGANLDKEILAEIHQLNSNNVHLIGEKTNVLDYLRVCDAFCLSSIHEGMPISLIEALSTGAIPICTPAGGIVDMIEDGKDGLLSTNFSTESYVSTILRFLNMTKSEKENMEIAGKRKFKNFKIEKTAKNYLNQFNLFEC